MIEKIKYNLSAFFKSRQVRLGVAALLTAIAVAGATLVNCSIHTIKVFDGQKTYTVRSLNNNVASVMENMDLKSKIYEVLETETSKMFTSVKIAYGFPVFITQGENTTKVNLCKGTVQDALKLAGITADEFDMVQPSLDTEITETTYIDFVDISFVNTTVEETVPFNTKTTYSAEIKKGEKKVLNEGKDGVNQVTYTEKFVNGVSVEKKATNTVVLSSAVDKQIAVGTKVTNSYSNGKYISKLNPTKEIELDANGVPVNYKSKMTVRATAYSHTGSRCATGVSPIPGYIAVNPKVIPYGTKMFIKTTDGRYIYGYAVAADTGGFVKRHPTGIDLFFDSESECKRFGVRSAEIYILE